MRWQSFALDSISNVSNFMRFGRIENGLRILTYHTVGGKSFGDKLGLNTVTPQQFDGHMQTVIDLDEVNLCNDLRPESNNKLSLHITFDDGYLDNLRVAAPILARFNIPFTVYVSTGFIGKKGFLNKSDLRELSEFPGATIGSHGISHKSLVQICDEELLVEIGDSKKILEDEIGRVVENFSYPYGDANRRVRNFVSNIGYQTAVCSRFDINKMSRDKLMLNRLVVLSGDSNKTLKQKITGAWDWYRFRKPDPLNNA